MDKYEDLENELDPHRREERAAAAAEVAARLRSRGIGVTGSERAEELDDLLTGTRRIDPGLHRPHRRCDHTVAPPTATNGLNGVRPEHRLNGASI